jgi:8-oxo-dGTP pyrophosphatase MutT (NUDIX family)
VVDGNFDGQHPDGDDDPGGRWPVERGPDPQIRAAGGVVWRVVEGRPEVAVVHRPKYGDWTFPKGKLDPGETEADAAFREVQEETGLRCVLGRELPSVEYLDGKGRHKRVRYWEMTVSDGEFTVNDEVDRLEWLDLDGAGARLTYDHDRDVLDAFGRFAGIDLGR